MARAEALDDRVITLARLEQEVARRTGPYFQAAQDASTSSTAISTVMPALRSTALLGGPENLWLLRRGRLVDGTPTPLEIGAVDRQRLVQSYDPGAGRVIVERNWGRVMYPSEVGEFIHLDPTQELRVAVLAGLRRCFFEDTLNLGYSSGYAGIDLTATAPWITSTGQVLNVQYGWQAPYADLPFNPFMAGGHVILGSQGMTMNGLWLTGLRPHWSWVNGADSTSGPTDDDDTLEVDLDYAASAAHIEAWHLFPSRMRAAAAAGLQASQEDAAKEFTRQAIIHGPVAEDRIGFSDVVGLPL